MFCRYTFVLFVVSVVGFSSSSFFTMATAKKMKKWAKGKKIMTFVIN